MTDTNARDHGLAVARAIRRHGFHSVDVRIISDCNGIATVTVELAAPDPDAGRGLVDGLTDGGAS